MKLQRQFRHVVADDAPEGIVVDTEITENETIAGGDHNPPGDFRVGGPNRIRICPGGHPNSPSCGHLKIPHLDSVTVTHPQP